ncbi:MAG TPA: thiamine phosphate synthase [Longimicrobiales bacterium]|nr:thiamine phosphate synthase [Longimicrobiales bacterium]
MRTPADLRLIVITDATIAAPRAVGDVVRAALAGGAPAIQLRMKGVSARTMSETGRALRDLTRAAHASLFVNDRLDVALAIGADGVHLGPDDAPVAAVRGATPSGFLIGYSTDRPDVARRAARDGADYIGCGAVFGTSSKDVGGERIGIERLDEVARAVPIPVVGIGGIHVGNVREIASTAAAGIAVIGAIMAAADPEAATRELLEALAGR